VANDDTATGPEDTAVTGDVIANDSDVDGDTLSVQGVNGIPALVGAQVTGSNGGTFTVMPDGAFVFEPGNDFSGLTDGETVTTSITSTVDDGHGGQSTATVTITITGRSDAVPDLTVTPTEPSALPASQNVAAEGTILNSMNTISPLNGVSELGETGIILAAANGAESLNGLAEPTNPASATFQTDSSFQTGAWGSSASQPSPSASPLGLPQTLSGFSVKMDVAQTLDDGSERELLVESLVRNDTVVLEINWADGLNATDPAPKFKVTQSDGTPLPNWLEQLPGGLILGERPADAESLSLNIAVTGANGETSVQRVEIQTSSGEIQKRYAKAAE